MAATLRMAPVEPGQDAVALFEAHRARLIRDKMRGNLLLAGGFLALLLWSIDVSRLTPERLAAGVPRIVESFGTVMPRLSRDVLFDRRNEAGRFPPGSLGGWYSDFWKCLRLIWEPVLMALTATLSGTGLAVVPSLLAARSVTPHRWAGVAARRFLEFCRGVPEILFALVFVFAVGIGPLLGTIFALGLAFLAARNTMPFGLVGAGGVGMIIIERVRAGLFDQVAFVVLNVLVVIAVIDFVSGRIRKRFIGERGH